MSKKVIRYNIWESNSSSSHSLTVGVLTLEQSSPEFKFDKIIIEPRHFGYNDIVEPDIDSNNFPELEEICKGCKHLKHNVNNYPAYNCTNKKYKDDEYNYININKCDKYNETCIAIKDKLVKDQSPKTRAEALFACIVCKCSPAPDILVTYFSNLLNICNEVYYRKNKINQENNTTEHWKKIIYHGNLGDYDSMCWMEEHGNKPENTEEIVNNVGMLKAFLFGEGSYAMGDRFG